MQMSAEMFPLQPAVVPILVGPLQALIAMLPYVFVALGTVLVSMFKPSVLKRFGQLLWSQKLIVAAVVVGVVGLVQLYAMVFPSIPADVASVEKGADWPLLRGTPDRHGATNTGEDPVQGQVVWSYVDGKINTFYASPALVGNRLYVTSARYEYFKDRGAVYCLDADTGKVVWKYDAGKYRATFSSPAVSGKYLVVGEGLHFTKDARVFCLDRNKSEEKREGVKLWEFRTKSHVESSPCIAGGRAFIGAGDDGLYCFALEPDSKGEAQVLWHLKGSEYLDCETSPVVHEGKVYFGLGLGGKAICCVDANTGKQLWRIPTPYPAFGSPSVADGKLYVGMGYGDYVNPAEDVANNLKLKWEKEGRSAEQIAEGLRGVKAAGEVWCIDLETHTVDWPFKAGRTVLGTVAVEGDRLYFGSRDGYFYCVSTKGKLIRKYKAREPIVTAPAIGDKHVYFVTDKGQLYGLDKMSLSLVWGVALNSGTLSSPAIARGHVYVGTSTAGMLCLGQPSSQEARPLWAGHLGGAGKSGWIDNSMLAKTGRYAWGVAGASQDAAPNSPVPSIHAPAAYVDGAVYVGLNRSDSAGLAKFHSAKDLGDEPNLAWFARSPNPVYLSAAGTGEAVFFVDGRPGDANRSLLCLDPNSGVELWRRPVAADASGQFVITYDRLFIADTAEALTCLDISSPAQCRKLWQAQVGPCVGLPCLTGDMVVVAVRSPASLAALDRQSGELLWSQPLPALPQTGPVFTAGRVWIGQGDGVVGYSMVADEPNRTVNCGPVAAPLACDSAWLVCLTKAGEVVLIDPEKAEVAARMKDSIGGIPPVLAGDALLYCAKESLRRFDLVSMEGEHWATVRARWPGRIVSPMIVVDSHVLFATDKEGFVCMKPKK